MIKYIGVSGQGKYLGKGRGKARGWTFELSEADLFDSPAKVNQAYRWAVDYEVQSNKRNASVRVRFPERRFVPDLIVPTLTILEVSIEVKIKNALT